jgi:DUF4097 and DUF4098 domain-containing protein YvlB
MFRYVATLLYAFSAVALGSSDDFDKVNGSIEVEPGREVGDVSTVNGSITIGSNARVQGVETVNGRIRLEPKATAQSVETVYVNVLLVFFNGSTTADMGAITSTRNFVSLSAPASSAAARSAGTRRATRRS